MKNATPLFTTPTTTTNRKQHERHYHTTAHLYEYVSRRRSRRRRWRKRSRVRARNNGRVEYTGQRLAVGGGNVWSVRNKAKHIRGTNERSARAEGEGEHMLIYIHNIQIAMLFKISACSTQRWHTNQNTAAAALNTQAGKEARRHARRRCAQEQTLTMPLNAASSFNARVKMPPPCHAQPRHVRLVCLSLSCLPLVQQRPSVGVGRSA